MKNIFMDSKPGSPKHEAVQAICERLIGKGEYLIHSIDSEILNAKPIMRQYTKETVAARCHNLLSAVQYDPSYQQIIPESLFISLQKGVHLSLNPYQATLFTAVAVRKGAGSMTINLSSDLELSPEIANKVFAGKDLHVAFDEAYPKLNGKPIYEFISGESEQTWFEKTIESTLEVFFKKSTENIA